MFFEGPVRFKELQFCALTVNSSLVAKSPPPFRWGGDNSFRITLCNTFAHAKKKSDIARNECVKYACFSPTESEGPGTNTAHICAKQKKNSNKNKNKNKDNNNNSNSFQIN